jgi:uncharacterized protein
MRLTGPRETGPQGTRVTFIVIAKEPVPGRVKTRLTPPFTHQQGAALAESALVDTLRAVAKTPATGRVLALAGEPGRWLPAGFDVIGQRGGGLDERLAACFDDAYRGDPMVLIGMDTPQVTPGLLSAAAAALESADAVFGPAADGGFWLLGLRAPDPSLLLGVPMSVPETGAEQLGRLRDAGLRVSYAPELTDVDTIDSAREVAATAPESLFAATFRSVQATGPATVTRLP